MKNNSDGRHTISNRMINNLKDVAYSQDDFGMDKYKTPLMSNLRYDWLKMAREELVDLGKYMECEAERKDAVTSLLRMAVKNENWSLVKSALFQLEMSGTAKEE